ncbi:hypothetical protein OE88DRAFT_1740089 [Heliocybe sulcata]|uniref:Uncharacterized protein n=1 Tax=Heliocybe sulcata TaxID=5364 RepID=A0A5C3MMX5_9AGAM|nr:hypothetical protein OE88DRAFT_1740089 [Heliocybe sulcata]
MTLTVLASFSFLALVVTARPILDVEPGNTADVDGSGLAAKPARAIQSFFASRTGLPAPPDSDIRVHLTTPAQQHALLQDLGLDAVKVIAPVESEEERKLYEAIGGSLNELDGGLGLSSQSVDEVAQGQLDVKEERKSEGRQTDAVTNWIDTSYSEPPELLVITACVAASIATFLGICALLIIITPIRRLIFGPTSAIRLEDGEKGLGLGFGGEGQDGEGDAKVLDEKAVLDLSEKATMQEKEEGKVLDEEKRDLITFEEPAVPAVQPPAYIPETPEVSEAPKSEEHPDPDLLPLPSRSATPSPLPPILNLPTNPPTPSPRPSPLPTVGNLPTTSSPTFPRSPVRKPLEMREIPRTPAQPSWATLASATASTSDLSIPGGLPLSMFEPASPTTASSSVASVGRGGQVRRLAAAVPIADPAWVVKLLVHALWGWMAVFVGGAR